MLDLLRDLVAHKGHANEALLRAVGQNGAAASDPELLSLLHHVLRANRFWLLTVVEEPFVFDDESRPAPSFEALEERFAGTQSREDAWIRAATPADLARMLRSAQIPGGECSVAQAFMQVCLHSHGHRAQAAQLLRGHGATPPATDFISWLATRPRYSGPT